MLETLGTERDDRYSDEDAEYYKHMGNLYQHQRLGINFLAASKSALLVDEMGLGKSRQALVAAQELYSDGKIDRVLILCPAAVRFSWRQELDKLEATYKFIPCIYEPKKQSVLGAGKRDGNPLPVLLVSYSLLPQQRHVQALESWCDDGATLLVCDESSFCKNRTAKQTKGAARISAVCRYRWLLTGTPIANSPLDLYGQSLVMAPNGQAGPLKSFKNFHQFQARYAVTQPMHLGRRTFKQVVGFQNIDELTKKFAPFVLRRTKEECLDLPAKSYTVREIALTEETWRIYQELRRDALLALSDDDVRPEPNAAVRLLRLCQLTSGHVGAIGDAPDAIENTCRDVSSEKLSWLCSELLDGELSSQQVVIVWCRWRRERERLQQMLAGKIELYRVFGGQQEKNRSCELQGFATSTGRRVLVAQPHAGGYGLNLTAASTAIYLSNDFSFTTRIQSEDRCHRIGQANAVTYVDVVAVGPRSQKTVDHHILECLRAKKSLAELTCSAWRKVLSDD